MPDTERQGRETAARCLGEVRPYRLDRCDPTAPTGLRAPGQRLWRSVVDVWTLDEHELALLVESRAHR